MAASLQVLAALIVILGLGILWGLAITDGPDLLDHAQSTGHANWLDRRWAAMSEAASLDPLRWFGIGIPAVFVSAGALVAFAERLAPRPPRAPF